MDQRQPEPMRDNSRLAAFAALVVAFMVVVIVEGAIVRATGSGNGCGNHWPLCNNQIIPQHPRLATIIEFTHRSLTGICATLVAALIVWTFFATPRGHRARAVSLWTGLLLLTEGALGAVLVLGGYVERDTRNARVLVQGVHFTNTMLLLAAMTLTWRLLTPRGPSPAIAQHRGLLWATLAVTLVTGAAGSVAALADTIFPAPSLRAGLMEDFHPGAPLLVHMRWIHPAAALCSIVLAALLAHRLGSGPASRRLSALLAAQVVLGVADIVLLTPTALQALHLLAADGLWIALVALLADALWPANPAPERETLPATKVPLSAAS